ncbi:hypothetical protein D3C76_482290 [compost metagenome]
MGNGGLERRLGRRTLGIGVDPLMVPGHRRELVDQPLVYLQPLTHMGLFPDPGLQLAIEGGGFATQLHRILFDQGRLAVDRLSLGCALLPHLRLLRLEIQHPSQQRVKVCLLLKLTPVVTDRRREPILELKGVLRQDFALVLQKIDNFHVPIPIRFKACKEV